MLLFCPNHPAESPVRSNRQQLLLSLEQASQLSSSSSASKRPSKRPLPPPGTPISILDFAEMTPEEQKVWLQGGEKGKDMSSSSDANAQEKRAGSSCSHESVRKQTAKCGSASPEEDNESLLPALDDSSVSEESEETNSVSSSASSSSQRSDDALIEKRSIFAPYWGQQSSSSSFDEERKEDNSSRSKKQVPRRVTAFPRPPSPVRSQSRFLSLPEEELPPANKVMTLLEELSFSSNSSLLPSQKTRSMPSILRTPHSEDEPRPLRRSQSVSFDARVDVIVYQELPPQGERPWWLSLRSF